MLPHVERLTIERHSLIAKHAMLVEFLAHEDVTTLDDTDRELMARQSDVMGRYITILTQRINKYKK